MDTSALLAVMDQDDRFCAAAFQFWEQQLSGPTVFLTSNYVVLETAALIQNRLGTAAVSLLYEEILPVIRQEWIDPVLHQRAVAALLAARRRNISLVDYTSFERMRQLGIRAAFAFDRHFAEQRFEVVPPGILCTSGDSF
ncbi:MAG: PIN domain-containing protein [Anaerolineae bacterium]|nr:PIN domain-containing protein [Anaerolineae bacterium]